MPSPGCTCWQIFNNQDAVSPNMPRVSYSDFGNVCSTYLGGDAVCFDAFSNMLNALADHSNPSTGSEFRINRADKTHCWLSGSAAVNAQPPSSYTADFSTKLTTRLVSTSFDSTTINLSMTGMTLGYVVMRYCFAEYFPSITWKQWDVKGGWTEVGGAVPHKELTTTNSSSSLRRARPLLRPSQNRTIPRDCLPEMVIRRKNTSSCVSIATEIVF